MNDKPAAEKPLHIRRAEGLRQLADAIEANPELGDMLSFALANMHEPISTLEEDPRQILSDFYQAVKSAGAEVRIENSAKRCRVIGNFGAISVKQTASAESMAGRQPTTVSYEPLVVED